MSYILDALRRAQAERERGQVPGLEARTLVHTPPPPPRRSVALWWLSGAVALAMLGLTLSIWLLRGAEAPVRAPVVGQAPTPTPTPTHTPTPTLSPTTPTSTTPVLVPVPMPVTPTTMVVVSAPAPPPAPQVAAAPPPAPPSASVRAVQLGQLSAELRRELPVLTVGGAIWSDNAASRFVIVNGQVLREGEAAAPGVLLERIGPKAIFLRWRDWRIEVPV